MNTNIKQKTKVLYILTLIGILLTSIFFRFFDINNNPAGMHADEASQGYNAYSLLNTGKDMFGKSFPILFRANGSFQPPIYTYLSIVPVYVFGNTIFAIRFISGLTGVLLVILVFLITRKYEAILRNQRDKFALVAAFIFATAPWAVHFSRLAVEANVALLIFILGAYLCYLSLNRTRWFPFAAMILGISTHAYYSERIIAVLFLPIFIIVFRKILLKNKKNLFIGLFIFALTQIPHLYILTTGALTKRLDQVSFIGNGSVLSVAIEFVRHYLSYFSPRNLFFDSSNNLARSGPDLSVFYDWYIIPFLFGISRLYQDRKYNITKILLILIMISPLPAAITGDLFYPLRTLEYLFVITVVISLGIWDIWLKIKNNIVKYTIFFGLLIYSVVSLYISSLVLFKFEEAHNYGYSYIQLVDQLKGIIKQKIIIDSSGRAGGIGTKLAYLNKINPTTVQDELSKSIPDGYYGNNLESDDIKYINNIFIRPILWGEVCGQGLLLIGDRISVSNQQSSAHKLNQEFIINNIDGTPELYGYVTKESCQ